MFLARYPSREVVARFLDRSRDLPLSYGRPIGLIGAPTTGHRLDEATVAIGRGEKCFARARSALVAWKQFEVGWVETFPRNAPIAIGTEVAVLFRHLGFWSLNGCRILYDAAPADDSTRFGFAYGTLSNHAIAGEELFEVYLDRQTEAVLYHIRATSWPRAVLARAGQPIVRALQRTFRRDSAAAMTRAVNGLDLIVPAPSFRAAHRDRACAAIGSITHGDVDEQDEEEATPNH
jgi:uncharacterized protein (UPF0548 family)